MVYINIADAIPVAYIPANGWAYGLGTLSLSVKNTTDGVELTLPHSLARSSGFLIRLELALPETFYAGEWQYTLTAGEDTIATGLLVGYHGNATAPVQYESENNVIQYGG